MRAIGGAARRAARAAREFVLEPVPDAERRSVDRGRADLPGPAPVPVDRGDAPASPPEPEPSPVVLATAIGVAGGAASLAAAVGVASAIAEGGHAALLVDAAPPERPRGPTLLASSTARELEDHLRAAGGGWEAAAARGHLCYLPLRGKEPTDRVAELLRADPPASVVLVHVRQQAWPDAVADPRLRARAALMRAELPADRALAALAVRELRQRGIAVKVVTRPLGRVASRRALAGIDPTGAASRRAARLARALRRAYSFSPAASRVASQEK